MWARICYNLLLLFNTFDVFLSVGSDLHTSPSTNMFLDLFPVFSIHLIRFLKKSPLLICPPASWLLLSFLRGSQVLLSAQIIHLKRFSINLIKALKQIWMSEHLVSVNPVSLTFAVVQADDKPQSLVIIENASDSQVSFKIKTTNPVSYLCRPSSGVVQARSKFQVQVIYKFSVSQINRNFHKHPRDRFLVEVFSEQQERLLR